MPAVTVRSCTALSFAKHIDRPDLFITPITLRRLDARTANTFVVFANLVQFFAPLSQMVARTTLARRRTLFSRIQAFSFLFAPSVFVSIAEPFRNA